MNFKRYYQLIQADQSKIILQIFRDRLFNRKFKKLGEISPLFLNKTGIEIGGPSFFFTNQGYLPLYHLAKKIDGCNFSSQTVWEGNIEEGNTYNYGKGKTGHQFICEGAEVTDIPKSNYDFLLSCNNLEHIANPLKAIKNWLHLLKPEGTVVLVLPRKESNFDRKRPITTFEHLLQDEQDNIGEEDLTHIDEIASLHDLTLDAPAGTREQFKERCYDNFNNRCMHHHVFDLGLLKTISTYFNLSVIASLSLSTDHLLIARK